MPAPIPRATWAGWPPNGEPLSRHVVITAADSRATVRPYREMSTTTPTLRLHAIVSPAAQWAAVGCYGPVMLRRGYSPHSLLENPSRPRPVGECWESPMDSL
jgi:hypothetical protein